MAVGTSRASAPAKDRVSADKVIEKQLARVRRQILFNDLIAGSLTLAAGLLCAVVVLVIVDHWIWGFGFWSRFLALACLAAGACWFVVTQLVPILFRQINPAYAAQTIERSEPGLKNSLLNYLLLRRDRTAIHERVFQALQHRAATDVSHVSVDQVVDRSSLITAGYCLAGIMAFAAAYTIISPKDPLQTFRRIANPWGDIARPARVQIESIEPGDSESFKGSNVNVSAIVHGTRENEPVRVYYSTVDGQTVDREVKMELDSSGLRHTAQLPPDGSGLTQNIRYRLVAGDCITRDYEIKVVAAPTIEVEAIDYDFPAYTKRPPETVKGSGDIRAIEGTRVTIRARTNQEIKTATIEFDPTSTANRTDMKGAPTRASERLPMHFKGTDASRSFMLELVNNRQNPKHGSYQLVFTNTSGNPSVQPILHRIDVLPDLAPEIEILEPRRERIEVPLSGRQKIEIRAIDPDFGLADLRLTAFHQDSEVLNKSLIENSANLGQLVATYEFRPKELGLEVGNQVTYWATAADNRTAPGTDSPDPNQVQTRKYQIVVVRDPASKGSAKDSPDEQPDQPQDAASENEKPRSNDSENSKPKNQNGQSKSNSGDAPQDKQPMNGSPEKNQEQGGKEQNQDGSQNDSSNGQGGGSDGEKGKQSSDKQDGSQKGGGSKSQTGETQQRSGQGTEGQESGGNTPQQDGKGASGTTPGENRDGPGEYREGEQSGNRTEPLHDGEVFEKALERMKKQQGQEKNKEQASDGQGQGGSGSKSSDSATGRDKQDADSNAPGDRTKSEPGAKRDQTKDPNATTKQDPSRQDQEGVPESNSDSSAAPSDGANKAQQPDKNQGAGKPREGAPGEGGKSARGGQERPQDEKKSAPDQGEMKEPGIGDNGESGAGAKSDDKKGSGSTEEANGEKIENRDWPKKTEPDGKSQGDKPEENSSVTSKKQSDSTGGQSGDQSGGGRNGSGQGANQAGNDSAGQNSSSDDGAGQSKEAGKGETSEKGGGDKSAKSPTGKSGDEKGNGSKSGGSPGGQGAKGSDQENQPPSGEGSKGPAGDGKGSPPSGATANSGKTSSDKSPSGGGLPSDRPEGTPPSSEPPVGDAANLEYARQTTNMVLDYLRDQKDKPDQQLLDELGWTAEDLRAFVERWEKMKNAAVEDENVKRDLEESLRSLGLQPRKDTRRTGTSRSDEIRGLRDTGTTSRPPSFYEEQYKAFKKGASRGVPTKSSNP